MNHELVTESNFNRLSIVVMEKYGYTYPESLDKLNKLTLFVDCNDIINESVACQIALLTVINTGKRAFLGGVYVRIPKNTQLLIKWPGGASLIEIITALGANLVNNGKGNYDFKLNIGINPRAENELQLVNNGWIGGVIAYDDPITMPENSLYDYPIAGVMSGSLAVGLGFLKVTGIDILAAENSVLISLWRPDLNWKDNEAIGPKLEYLPQKYWILGLGHLGQAHLWNIGFLPYPDEQPAQLLLQDFDKVIKGNYTAGLLCEETSIGKFKTRICSDWLERRNFQTVICERRYDGNTIRENDEPYIALSGFDSSDPRLHLEKSGFDLVVECGLGGRLDNFDEFILHTFPNGQKTPQGLWGNLKKSTLRHKTVLNEFQPLKHCGILAMTLASKAISASFVGAFTSSFAISEVIRGLHDGYRYDDVTLSFRDMNNRVARILSKYNTETSRNGFIKIN